MNTQLGKVILVGAGPGDPGLLTLRGAEALALADMVIYDYLASSQLLARARTDAELVCLGKHGCAQQGQIRLWTQQEINERLIREAQNGKTVVRLKGGDPVIFGRLAEELSALEAAGVEYEIVPGISTAMAAGSYAGIPITHRDFASCVTFIAGRESPGKEASAELDYSALAKLPGTLIFYMGVTTAPRWSKALIEHGKSADTPVAMVRRCSMFDQSTYTGTLGEVAEIIASQKIRPPVIFIVGEVARHGKAHDWFTSRPLFGQTVLVTRPQHQSAEMVASLIGKGARVLCQPAIEIGPPSDWQAVDTAIAGLAEQDWLVFSSRNGVQKFLNRLLETGQDMRGLAGTKIAAIGPATVEALREFGLTADLFPKTYRAEALAGLLAEDAKGKRFLLVRASRGREVLADMLSAAEGKVQQVVAYMSCDVARATERIRIAMASDEIDWTTVTSSAIARSLVKIFGKHLHQTRLAAISPLTADVLRELGFEPAVVAKVYTSKGLEEAILSNPAG